MNDYQLIIDPEPKHVFVTQLREEDDKEATEELKQIPVVKEKAGRLLETGINTLQTTLLLKKELEVDQIQLELDAKKREFAERIDACKSKELQLKAKQTEIKERIDKFDKFIKDNEAKRRRAIKKYQQELKTKEHKTKELDALQSELDVLLVRHEKLKAKLAMYAGYEGYLMHVVDRFPEDYLEATENIISALMMRYKTLSSTNKSLLQNLAKNTDEVEEGHQLLQDLRMKHTQQLLLYNGELAKLQKQLEKSIEENAKLEHEYLHLSLVHRDQNQTLGQIKIAIENISDRCLGERHHVSDHLTFERRLDIIESYMQERECVLEMASAS